MSLRGTFISTAPYEFTHLSGVNSAHSPSTLIFCLKCSHLEKVQFTYQPSASKKLSDSAGRENF